MDLKQKSSADLIIKHLSAIDVDGETMEYIIKGTHLQEQMLRQLVMKSSDSDINSLLEERDTIHDSGGNSHFNCT